jgi:nucleoid-associated protein YgaU
MSRFAFNPEMSGANFAPTGGEAAATTAIDAHRAAVFQPGIESHAAGAVAGAEQSIMTAVQAAAQPISPLIQMIMRMPGQIGLLSSMFEALGNFLMGHADLLAGLDFSHLAEAAHSALTSLPGSEHMGINLSLLPDSAPIFQNLHGLGSLGGGSDILGGAKGAAGQFNTPDILKDSVSFRDQLKVSGTLDLNKPQFEAGRGMSSQVDGLSKNGDALSGPAMRDTGGATHLAGANRLFGDRPVGLTSHSPMASSTSVAQSVPISGQGSVPSSLNVNASNFQTDTSAAGGMSDVSPTASASQNVGFNVSQLGKSAMDSSTTGSIGPSGAVTDQLGGNQLVAMDKGVATFHPTLGSPDASSTTYDAGYLQHQAPTDASHHLGGLKAKELSLDSFKDGAKHATSAHANPTAHAAPAHTAAPAHAPSAHDAAPSHADTAHASAAHDSATAHTKPAAEQHISQAKPVMDHIGHQTAGSSHSHSASLNGHDGISHVNRTPAQVAQPRIAAQSASPQHGQMLKPADASHVAVDQVAPNQQMAAADGSHLQPQAADAAQATDGTQVAQAGDAPQAPAAGAPTQAASAAPTSYTIRAGDCLWNIAKDQLGAPTRWSEIYKMNADVLGSNPSMIHPGTNINLPGGGSEVASGGLEHGTYIVKAGDNLWDISKHLNGDGSKWGEIYKLNQDVIGANPSLITPGQELQLPGTGPESAGTLAQAPAAAASQQLAQGVPQAAGAPTVGSGADLRMEGGTPLTAEAALPQAPVHAPTEVQAQAPAAAPEAAMEAPQAPAAQAAAAQTAAPAQAAAAAPVAGGPGAAAAATLPAQQPSAAELHQMGAAKHDGIVSSNLTADLAQFIHKSK